MGGKGVASAPQELANKLGSGVEDKGLPLGAGMARQREEIGYNF